MGFLDKLREKDNFWIGLALGIALPLILYPIISPLDAKNFPMIPQSDLRRVMLKMMPYLLSRCVFPNALVFFFAIWGHFNLVAKGILYASIGIVGILIVLQLIF